MENKDTQLPAEVLEEIQKRGDKLYPLIGDVKKKIGFKAGAAEYATQLHAARTLLEKVIHRHEGGLLPDRFIYDEIKNFLDGTK
jgi:hypothetical protein